MCKKDIKKAKNFLLKPSKAFEQEKKTKLADAFKYMLLFGILFSVLSTAVVAVLIPETAVPLSLLLAFVSTYVMLIVKTVIGGLWLHLWAYIFKARKGVVQTLKISLYSETPYYLLGWIPYISLVGSIWSLVVKVPGLMKLQDMKKNYAIAAVVIEFLIPIAVVLLVVYLYPELFLLQTETII